MTTSSVRSPSIGLVVH